MGDTSPLGIYESSLTLTRLCSLNFTVICELKRLDMGLGIGSESVIHLPDRTKKCVYCRTIRFNITVLKQKVHMMETVMNISLSSCLSDHQFGKHLICPHFSLSGPQKGRVLDSWLSLGSPPVCWQDWGLRQEIFKSDGSYKRQGKYTLTFSDSA